VAFVFLNTNQDAHFVHDDVSVPVVEGTLVHFNGAIPHHTIVNSGVVQLLGPIYSNDFTATVGGICSCECGCDADSCANESQLNCAVKIPCTGFCAECCPPTMAPTTALPTKAPTKAKSTKAPAKAKAGKQGKGKVTSNVPDDNSTGDSNGEIEIPLYASMPTSLSVPAADIPGDSFGKIDEIPFDASLSMTF
jgi:hypothetical protein